MGVNKKIKKTLIFRVFCASSFVNHKKYNDCIKTYYQLREAIGTSLCAEYGLSVIPPNQNKGKSHYKWQMYWKGNSWKIQLRTVIDMCIKSSRTFEDFTSQMQVQGYEIKYGKYIAFRAEKKRFTRAMQLGKNYTEENIKLRIAPKDKLPIKKTKKISLNNEPLSIMIVLENNKKVIESKGYEPWAKLHNLKQNAKTVNLLNELGMTSLE
ncbi:relaxase/mobilization nuclease domain-containing protein [Listeria goaensis]|uniref:relaxase/mobilization nuclease domain-containing protein n=1 Tax=Listeria goaensis TaxID=1649188 RepID=UPI001F085F95|nr:relaxase/mobilization nuclease domain-containing protein [Listeria goaensis]